MTVHSTQRRTVKHPQKVWIIDDYMQWSNLAFLAVSRVEYMDQLTRVVVSPDGDTPQGQQTDQQLCRVIAKKTSSRLQAPG